MSGPEESTQTSQLPPPPFSGEVDLRRYPNIPLDVQRLRDSDFVVLASADEFRAGLLLLCASWHQVPAGSLPVDDRLLCALAKVEMKKWKMVKQGALRGFVQHSDGRLYHPVLTETVLKSWATMRAQKQRTAAATETKKELHVQRNVQRNVERYDVRNDHQRKGKEININKPPQPQVVGGGGFSENEIGLGDMLTGTQGFADPVLLDSLTMAAGGASGEQLERAAAVIKAGGDEINNLTGWSLEIARRAAAGQVTSLPQPAAAAEQPARDWEGKEGWRMHTEQYGQLVVEMNGMLRSSVGILHPTTARTIAARVKAGEITLQP